MTDSDDTKTKEELLAEIETLRQQLAAKSAGAAEGPSGGSNEPSFSRPITRREALKNWIAPVVLSVPIAAALSTERVQAQTTGEPTQPPTSEPSLAPTQEPRPPQPPEAHAVPGLGAAGAVALGGALAAAGAKVLKDKKNASDEDGNE